MSPDRATLERVVNNLHALSATANGAPMVLLSPGSEGILVAMAPASRPSEVVVHLLQVGPGPSSAVMAWHAPPTPEDVEHAIELVEDALMPLARHIAPESVLFVDAGSLREAYRGPATKEGGATFSLSIAEVEMLFAHLAAVVQGRPVASTGVQPTKAFAWHLIVVREAVHHWDFAAAHFF